MSRGTTLALSKEALRAQKSIVSARRAWSENPTVENLLVLVEARAYFAGISYGLSDAAEVASKAERSDWKKELQWMTSREAGNSQKEGKGG